MAATRDRNREGFNRLRNRIRPTFFTTEGFRFFFYSNDHEPMHVHVQHADGEASFVLVGDVVLRDSRGMKLQELRRAEELIRARRSEIEEKWNEFFG